MRVRDVLLGALLLYNAYHSTLFRVALDFSDSHPDLPQLDALLGVLQKSMRNLGLTVNVADAERTDLDTIDRFRTESLVQYNQAESFLLHEDHLACKTGKTCVIDEFKIQAKDDGRDISILSVYRKSNGPKPKRLVVYFHPGGGVVGDKLAPVPFVVADIMSAYVLSVGYRKAPEHPYPAAVNDGFEVMLWASANAHNLVTDVDKLTLAGDSAGSLMASAVALKWKQYGGKPAVHDLVLNIPMLSPVLSRSYGRYQNIHFLDAKQMIFFWDMYATNVFDCVLDPICSPGTATVEQLKGIAKNAMVMPALADVLFDEGKEFARKLALAGVNTTYLPTRGTHIGSFLDPNIRSGRVLKMFDY